jgi:hypothetical protein
MSAEPIVIYSYRIDPVGVLQVLRELAPDVEVEGTGDAWSRATIRERTGLLRKARTLSFGHSPDYYAGPDWTTQMRGMQGYFSRFPEAPQKSRIMRLIAAFRFALTLWPVPEPDLYIDSEDPRLRYVFAVAKHLDAALFLPSGLRDASGRLLYGAEPADPAAIMPAIYHDVLVKPRSERTRADFGTVPNVGDPPPPTAARVARRACALAAVTGRALLEQERLDDPNAEGTRQEILSWLDAIGIRQELEPREAEFLKMPLGAPPRQQAVDFTWRLEGLAVLAWALGRFELPPYDQLVTPADLLRSLGILDADAARNLLASPSLRPPEELAAQRERIFTVHWRLTDWRVRPKPMDFEKLARTAWFGPLDLSGLRIVESDLAIGDLALSRAPADAVGSTASAAMERHLAANWLNGGSEIYSETDVST